MHNAGTQEPAGKAVLGPPAHKADLAIECCRNACLLWVKFGRAASPACTAAYPPIAALPGRISPTAEGAAWQKAPRTPDRSAPASKLGPSRLTPGTWMEFALHPRHQAGRQQKRAIDAQPL